MVEANGTSVPILEKKKDSTDDITSNGTRQIPTIKSSLADAPQLQSTYENHSHQNHESIPIKFEVDILQSLQETQEESKTNMKKKIEKEKNNLNDSYKTNKTVASVTSKMTNATATTAEHLMSRDTFKNQQHMLGTNQSAVSASYDRLSS